MAKPLYVGYSSYNYQTAKSFKLTDIEIVEMDLLNHIFTRRGERVMMPTFGTRIPDMAFEPLDDITLDIIREDLMTVVRFDPRVQLLDLQVIPDYDNNTVTAAVKLLYVEINLINDLNINIATEGSTQ